jgi:hypothetical protein
MAFFWSDVIHHSGVFIFAAIKKHGSGIFILYGSYDFKITRARFIAPYCIMLARSAKSQPRETTGNPFISSEKLY